jgi:hypothetical protein
MAKKLWKQLWSVSGDNGEYVNVREEGTETDVTENHEETIFETIPEKEIVGNLGFAAPSGDPEEVLELTDEEAQAIEEGIKEFGHSLSTIEEISDDARLSRIKDKLSKMI